MQNFHSLIVSVVEICKQCLQTASASGALPTGALPLDPGVPKTPRVIAPNKNFWFCHYIIDNA